MNTNTLLWRPSVPFAVLVGVLVGRYAPWVLVVLWLSFAALCFVVFMATAVRQLVAEAGLRALARRDPAWGPGVLRQAVRTLFHRFHESLRSCEPAIMAEHMTPEMYEQHLDAVHQLTPTAVSWSPEACDAVEIDFVGFDDEPGTEHDSVWTVVYATSIDFTTKAEHVAHRYDPEWKARYINVHGSLPQVWEPIGVVYRWRLVRAGDQWKLAEVYDETGRPLTLELEPMKSVTGGCLPLPLAAGREHSPQRLAERLRREAARRRPTVRSAERLTGVVPETPAVSADA